MSGSMYDLSVTTLSPEGKIFQIEYAQKCVDQSDTAIAIKCKDGIILGTEKRKISKLMVENGNRRIYNVDYNIGAVLCGKVPDGRALINRAIEESKEYENTFAIPISGNTLADRMGLYTHHHTLQHWKRPFGASVLFASYNEDDGYKIHLIEPSGINYAYHACSVGKGRQLAKAAFEERNFRELTCREALKYVAKILFQTNEEFDKKYEIELSWLTQENKNIHKIVPNDIRLQAEKEATELINKEDMGEE